MVFTAFLFHGFSNRHNRGEVAPTSIIGRGDVGDSEFLKFARQPGFEGVVQVLVGGTPGGTAEVIDERWLLTAAHVVQDQAGRPIEVMVRSGPVPVKEIVVHPRYREPDGSGRFLSEKGVDLALLRVDSIGIAPLPTATGELQLGTEVAIVGFGRGGPWGQSPPGDKRAGTNVLDALGGMFVNQRQIPDYYLVTDFDSPTMPELNPLGSGNPRGLEALASAGDSGGGLFTVIGGRWVLVGVYTTTVYRSSFVQDGMDFGGSLNYFVSVPHFAQWIESTINN